MKASSAGFCLSVVLLLAGCGGGGGLPEGETGTVSGRITFEGKPVPEGCGVVFMRDKGGYVGTGKTDSSGQYLLYMRDGLQIVVGTYRVSITPPNPVANLDQDEIMRLQSAGKLPDTSKMKEVPDRYRDPENSKTIFEVKPGSNTFDLDMKP